MSLSKLVLVIGTTGSGKSKLAIELAKKFGGEIINADSMQVYNALPICTNRESDSQRQDVPHHLFGFLEPENTDFSVASYQPLAIQKISEVHAQNKIPILVGGTHYFIESVIWDKLINTDVTYSRQIERDTSVSTEALYSKLEEVDAKMAARLHPHDRRKISRSLQIYHSTGRKPSELYYRKRSLRFNCCVLWPHTPFAELDDLLDQRIEDMLTRGLISELWSFYQNHFQLFDKDQQRGLLQCIGLKEFIPYFKSLASDSACSHQEQYRLRQEGVELMKIHTRQYARAQIKWIRNRLRYTFPIYGLNADEKAWMEKVQIPAEKIVHAFLHETEVEMDDNVTLLPRIAEDKAYETEWKKYTCDYCNRTLNGRLEWETHLKTRGHKRKMQRFRSASGNESCQTYSPSQPAVFSTDNISATVQLPQSKKETCESENTTH